VTPVSPVMPGSEPIEKRYGEGQEEYVPLPAVYQETEPKQWIIWKPSANFDAGPGQFPAMPCFIPTRSSRPVISRWRLTDEERQAIAAGADIVLTLLSFGGPLTPSHLQVTMPDEMPVLVEEP